MTDAVLMDMDGTLFDTEKLSFEGWKLAGEQLGYPMTAQQILDFRGRSRTENDRLFRSWFGEDAPYWELRKVRTSYMDDWMAKNGIPLKRGLFAMLRSFYAEGRKTCLATGTAREKAQSYWERSGILRYLDATICGDEVNNSKPDPEIFLRAAAKLELPSEHCFVIEDSPNGVEAARRAGCRIVIIPDLTPPTEAMTDAAEYVACNLIDAANYIQKGARNG